MTETSTTITPKGTTPLRNSVWNALGSTMLGLNTFILLMLVSRFFDVATVGAFGIALTTAQLLYFVGLFGVDNYQMTDFKEQFSFSGYYWTRIITSSLMMVICLIAVVISSGEPQKSLFILLLTLFYLLNLIGDLYQRLFFQKNRLDMSGKALFFRTAFSSLIFTVMIMLGVSIEVSLVYFLVVNLICTWIWDLVPARHFVPNKKVFSLGEIIAILNACLPLFISILLMNVIFNLSKYGIAFILDDAAQGWYNMLFIPTQVIGLISSFIFMPLFN
ncbi:MAG: oligosaccharide flippase family protein, partial [Coriobacteriaceae bacterium]|nr:oligosaccharide flippase family protein [Coriobacteriaceae bacterium]